MEEKQKMRTKETAKIWKEQGEERRGGKESRGKMRKVTAKRENKERLKERKGKQNRGRKERKEDGGGGVGVCSSRISLAVYHLIPTGGLKSCEN